MYCWCISKAPNHHLRDNGSCSARDRFTPKFFVGRWALDLKVKRWYKYVFGHCVDEVVYFGGSALAWI